MGLGLSLAFVVTAAGLLYARSLAGEGIDLFALLVNKNILCKLNQLPRRLYFVDQILYFDVLDDVANGALDGGDGFG